VRRKHHRRGSRPVLGSTFTGDYENVAALSAALDRLRERTGLDIPIHVDDASGAFLQPHLVWDFRLPRAKSINTSGHKHGLVYPGVGWIVWREASDVHPDLIFNVDYLGGTMPTLAIDFSRPASQVVAQYYNAMFITSGARFQEVVSLVSNFLAYLWHTIVKSFFSAHRFSTWLVPSFL